jgi:voltage-gated potassium channel Kch
VSKAGLVERMRYRFDQTMSRGTPALIGWLGLASTLLIGVVTGLLMLFARNEELVENDPWHTFWISLLRTLDPGTMGQDTGGPVLLGLMLTVTIGGIFIVSALVGVLTTGLDAKLSDLRKGRSRVVESGHTVVLGWSEQIFTLVLELSKAEERNETVVVILADRDKVEMEDEIRKRTGRLSGVRVVCRTGTVTEPAELEIARPDDAAVIVVPAPAVDDPDIHVIKTFLALNSRAWPDGRPPVVGVVSDSTNLPAAQLAAGPGVEIVDAEDITARLVVQSRRQPGLSAVYTELLGFDNDEIYMRTEPRLAGTTFHDALFAFDTATLIGLRHADGRVELNPPHETVLRADDEVIALAAGRSRIHLAPTRVGFDETAISDEPRDADPADRTLVLNWNDRGPTIVRLLDDYLPPGSTVDIAAVEADGQTAAAVGPLRNLSVSARPGDPTNRSQLEALAPGQFQHVIVLAEDAHSPQHADARTLVTLLHLRDMKQRTGEEYSIVSELNDDANRRLAQVIRADDFVVSQKLISLLLTQLVKNRYLNEVFTELFDARGCDIFLKPAEEYLRGCTPGTFATVIEAASRRREVAIGYRVRAQAYVPPMYGVELNPPKDRLLILSPEDRIIVLSND